MRAIICAVLMALSAMASASASYGPDSSGHATDSRLYQERKIAQANISQIPDENSAKIQLLLSFPKLLKSNIKIINPQKVSFRNGIEGFSEPNEKVWIVGAQDLNRSIEHLYLVNLSSGRVVILCTNKFGLVRECL